MLQSNENKLDWIRIYLKIYSACAVDLVLVKPYFPLKHHIPFSSRIISLKAMILSPKVQRCGAKWTQKIFQCPSIVWRMFQTCPCSNLTNEFHASSAPNLLLLLPEERRGKILLGTEVSVCRYNAMNALTFTFIVTFKFDLFWLLSMKNAT